MTHTLIVPRENYAVYIDQALPYCRHFGVSLRPYGAPVTTSTATIVRITGEGAPPTVDIPHDNIVVDNPMQLGGRLRARIDSGVHYRPTRQTRFGLHLRADGRYLTTHQRQREIDLFNSVPHLAWYKMLSSGDPDVPRMLSQHTGVLRLFQKIGPRRVSATELFEWNRADLAQFAGKIELLELLNEPNLYGLGDKEGGGMSWPTGYQLTAVLGELMELLDREFGRGTFSYGAPALSPGTAVPGLRHDETSYRLQMEQAGLFEMVDWIAVHTYFSPGTAGGIRSQLRPYAAYGKRLIITEASCPSHLLPHERALLYRSFERDVTNWHDVPVTALLWYVASASGAWRDDAPSWVYDNQVWMTEDGTPLPFVNNYVGMVQ